MADDPTFAKRTLLWTIIGALATVLALLFLEPVRAFLWLLGHEISTAWRWFGVPHSVPGWLLAFLIAAGGFGAVVGVVALLASRQSSRVKPFAVTLEKLHWRGWITREGKVVGDPVPHCPLCQCELRWDIDLADDETYYICDDCCNTMERFYHRPQEILERITRRVEAQWRRGELPAPEKAAKTRRAAAADLDPTAAANVGESS